MTTGVIIILGLIFSVLIASKFIDIDSLEDRDKYRDNDF